MTVELAQDCCIALCSHKYKNEPESCYFNPSHDNYIRSKISFNLSCQCNELYEHGQMVHTNKGTSCGQAELYGDFDHSPGFYVSPSFLQKIALMLYVIPFLILIGLLFKYAHYRTKNVEMIVQNHFDDWKELGIKVQYRFPQIPQTLGHQSIAQRAQSIEAQRLQNAGAIFITMPSSVSVPTSCEPINSQNIYSSTLPPSYSSLRMQEI